mmetsp:Transcript_2137/g.5387  ORF Transcript_2137/g.5387 Transcript_2137/m.5387 type:complete len:200 (-) Transcript_2137:21-620(-)
MPTLISSSVLSISLLHNSFFSYSSFCCVCNCAIILSMASFTLLKSSRRTRIARDAKAQFLFFLATAANRTMARWAARSCASMRVSDDSCKNVSVFPKSSRESSSVKIFKVSPKATSSSPRILERALNCSSSLAQSFFMLDKKSWSASMAFVVASLSSSAFACASKVSAKSASFLCFCSVATAISASLAAFKFWNETSAS